MIGYKINDSFGQIGSGTTPKSNDDSYYADNGIPWLNSGDLTNKEVKFIKKKITDKALSEVFSGNVYHEKSLAIAMYGATIGKTGIVNGGFVSNQACCILSKPLGVNLNYVQYVINSSLDKLLLESQGGGQQNINQDIIKNFRFFAPEKSEQEDIARYLDKKIVLIDNKIDHLTQKLHHLEEYKTALIHNAVTKGLDANNCRILDGTPAEEMKWKDSGVEWIGEIPDDASAIRLRDSVTSFKTGSRDTNHYVENGLYDFFTCGKEIRKINDKPFSGEAILINGNGDVGKARLVNTEFDAYQRVYVLQGMKVSSYLLCEQINLGLPNELKRDKKGSVIAFATLGDITGFKIVSFNKNESLSISNYLEKSNQLFEQCTNAINKKIALLLEYKKSLINEAVSGQ